MYTPLAPWSSVSACNACSSHHWDRFHKQLKNYFKNYAMQHCGGAQPIKPSTFVFPNAGQKVSKTPNTLKNVTT
jgi:hypothetical protein